MCKPLKYVPVNERFELIQKTAMMYTDLFKFEADEFEPDLYERVRALLTAHIAAENPDYKPFSKKAEEEAESTISSYIAWLKRRNEHGKITWEELTKRLRKAHIQGNEIRVQIIGKYYCQFYFNCILNEGEVFRLFRVNLDGEGNGRNKTMDTRSYAAISKDDIEEIDMGGADLIYSSGLREVTVTYKNGERISLKFSEGC